MPNASGMSNFVRITAGAVGTSIFTTLWENRAALHHAQLAEAINLGNENVSVTGFNIRKYIDLTDKADRGNGGIPYS